MQGYRRLRRGLTAWLALLLASLLPVSGLTVSADTAEGQAPAVQEQDTAADADALPDYREYEAAHRQKARPQREIVLTAAQAGCPAEAFEGREAIYLDPETQAAAWTFTAGEEGMYRIRLEYYPVEGRSKPVEAALLLDGAQPFDGCGSLKFGRVWKNSADTFRNDAAGNQLRPTQVECPGWLDADAADRDVSGRVYEFYLTAGEHRLSLAANEEAFRLASLTLYNPEPVQAYAQAGPSAEQAAATPAYVRTWEAETAPRKSDATLYPSTDRTSPLTTPYDPVKVQMNTIGGSTWAAAGQWIEWDIEVPADGYYTLVLRARQNVMRGMKSYRRLTIDGAVPYTECEALAFRYDSKWQVVELGDGTQPYYFHLTAGRHTIRLEAVLGEIEYSAAVLEEALTGLNTLYRRVVMITGTVPDTLRDYSLHTQIPDLVSSMRRYAQVLTDEIERIERLTGSEGSEASFLRRFAEQLISFADKPDTIPERLSYFKSNISALSTLLLSLHQQPLELDTLTVATAGYALPRANANFFEQAAHEIKAFAASFFNDYAAVGAAQGDGEPLKVWLTTGRDQAQIIRTIVDDLFQPQYGIGVELSLIQGSVTEPIMAGRGPDIVIGIGRAQVTDLAARGALLPLDGFDGLDAVKQRFQATAAVPYMYDGKLYALPETQEFNMMFVRTDIYDELGLDIPETWEDVRRQAGIVQQNNLNMGLVNGVHSSTTTALNSGLPSILTALLCQNGMQYYRGDLSATVFSTPEAVEVYKTFTSFFTDLSFTVYFDAANQFRTGEMPLIIAPLSTYNTLYISAPEIRGLWRMVPIPGTPGENGTDIRQDGTGTGTLILRGCENPQAAWQFLEFWSSAEVQVRFAQELETLLGAGARYMTANTEAFYGLSWSRQELEEIRRQRDAVTEFPQVPGSYILTRNLTNAFVAVTEGENVRETLLKYARIMDGELERKQAEFGYTLGGGYYGG